MAPIETDMPSLMLFTESPPTYPATSTTTIAPSAMTLFEPP